MDTDTILNKYGLNRDTTTAYIDAISRMNQTQAADELNVSRDTINRYKNKFQEMTPVERLLLISSLAQDQLLEETAER